MGWNDELRGLIQEQDQLQKKLEGVLRAYEEDNDVQENEWLKERVQELESGSEVLKKKAVKYEKEARDTKAVLHQYIIEEKLTILKSEKEKLEAYFGSRENIHQNRLTMIIKQAKRSLDEMSYVIDKEMIDEDREMRKKIALFKEEIEEQVRQKREKQQDQIQKIRKGAVEEIDELKDLPVNEDVFDRRLKQGALETKIGLHWLNKIGAIVILIGMVVFLRHSYMYFFTPVMQGIFGMLVGFLFIGGGAYFSTKKIFSRGLMGAGLGILYITTFMSYFILKIINLNIAFLLCILISAGAVIMSTKLNSKTIGSIALIGGYLPLCVRGLWMWTDIPNQSEIRVLMGYGVLLVIIALFMANKKNWPFIMYLSYGFNLITTFLISYYIQNNYIVMALNGCIFLGYLIGTLYYPFVQRSRFRIGQIILIGVNTVISCVTFYSWMGVVGWERYRGLMCIVFCLIYIGLERWVKKYLPEERATGLVFYITALTFSILIIPVQIGMKWGHIGWLVEAVLLIVYGIRHGVKKLEISGDILLGLYLVVYYVGGLGVYGYTNGEVFVRNTVLIAGLIAVLAVYLMMLNEGLPSKSLYRGVVIYKYFVMLQLVVYISGSVSYMSTRVIGDRSWFVDCLGVVIGGLIVASLLLGIRRLQDRYTLILTSVLWVITSMWSILANVQPALYMAKQYEWFFIILLAISNVWLIGICIKLGVAWQKASGTMVNICTVGSIISIFVMATLFLEKRYGMRVESVGMSLVYVGLAFGCIVYGFKKRVAMVRYFGLGITIFALAKLFLFDIAYRATVGMQIVGYFGFGMILLAISFLYQKFMRPLDGSAKDEDKDGN